MFVRARSTAAHQESACRVCGIRVWLWAGPLDHTTNYPLRGGKHTFWDGGVRVVAGLGGGLLDAAGVTRGRPFRGLVHSADWMRTLVEGVAGSAPLPRNGTGPMADDSAGSIGSPMPGMVEKVAIKKGQTVAQGDVLMVVSAMKMEVQVRQLVLLLSDLALP